MPAKPSHLCPSDMAVLSHCLALSIAASFLGFLPCVLASKSCLDETHIPVAFTCHHPRQESLQVSMRLISDESIIVSFLLGISASHLHADS
jgi:hypothetical protein